MSFRLGISARETNGTVTKHSRMAVSFGLELLLISVF